MDITLLKSIGTLIFGIIVLVFSGDYLVRGSVAIANHFKISSLVIGLTVVAFGTSAPELIVSLNAVITGHPEIALGNVIGSNIVNIALVLALTVIILPMPVSTQTIKRSWPIMLISGLVLYASMYDGMINRTEGIIMFILFILFIISSIKSSKRFEVSIPILKPKNEYKIWVYLVFVVLASGGLALGSRFLVLGASDIAAFWGVSERVISITIVAFGTSIPELTASIIAAVKKETDISVGNIIGSNIFNVFAVIGITSSISVIPVNFPEFRIDLNFMIAIYLLLFIFMLPMAYLFKKEEKFSLIGKYKGISGSRISRVEGLLLLLIYIAYIVVLFKF